ncbi:MAG TPA: hypothetical protein GXX20_04420 [Clostridiaceae bacterium]|nr:hypothetical protein [Clostridiaceae bacterium]
MISCTEFIPAYSELFNFLEELGGKEAVKEYWDYCFDGPKPLKKLVEEHSIKGCWLYWTRTLNEEAADFTLELDEEAGEFNLYMHHCPSKGRLLEFTHIKPYHAYCEHCDYYRKSLEPLGYEYHIDLSECDKAKCTIKVRRK